MSVRDFDSELDELDDGYGPRRDAYGLTDSLDTDRLAILVALRRGCAAKFIDCEPQSAAQLAGRIADLTAEIDALNPEARAVTGSAGDLIEQLRSGLGV